MDSAASQKNLQWDNGPFYEQYGDKVIAMSPPPAVSHIDIAGNIYGIIRNYLKGKRCKVFPDGVEVYLGDEFKFRPDVTVVCDRDKIKADGIHGAPDLVVEVLSPSTFKRDRTVKKDAYEKYGVKEYWLVSGAEKTIEVYHLRDGKFVFDNGYSIIPEWQWEEMTEEEKADAKLSLKVSLYEDLVIDIREIFEDI